MKKIWFTLTLLSITLLACQKQQMVQPTKNQSATTYSEQQLKNTAAIFNFINRKFDQNAASQRFEGLPNFNIDGFEETMEDVLTAVICHKSPGYGEVEIVRFDPVFTFNITEDTSGAFVEGHEVEAFINTVIDTIISTSSNLSLELSGTLLVAMLDIQTEATTSNSITYKIDVYYMNETEAMPEDYDYESDPEAPHFPIICPLTETHYNPIAASTISLFNSQFNNPVCNPHLRWRQREHLNGNPAHNPPHPSTFNPIPMPGFIWRLMYSGINTSDVDPSLPAYQGMYTNHGAYNIWSDLTSNGPNFSITGDDMTLHRDGISRQSMEQTYFSLSSIYWDPIYFMISDWFGTIQNQPIAAQAVQFSLSEWKWVFVPDYNYWPVSINFETGITLELNP